MVSRNLQYIGPGHRMSTASNWETFGAASGAPVAGDTAYIRNGTVCTAGEGAGVNVRLNNGTLNMTNGSINTITVDTAQYSATMPGYGTLGVTGRVVGTGYIGLGAWKQAPDTLNIILASHSAYVNQGVVRIENGSHLVATGKHQSDGLHARFENDSRVEVNSEGTVRFNADVTGTGLIRFGMTPIAAMPGVGHGVFAGAVSSGQTVAIDLGTVELDQALSFAGTIVLNRHMAPVGGSDNPSLDYGSVLLKYSTATTASLSAGGELTLRDNGRLVADLKFAPTQGNASLWVMEQGNGDGKVDSTVISGHFIPGFSEVPVSLVPVRLS